MRRTFLAVVILTLAGATPARAISERAGTSGAAFLKMGQGSARAMGLARAYVAMAEGSDALTWNPAGLALTQQKEIVYSFLRYVQEVDSPLYLGYAHPMGRTVWGANIGYMSISGLDVRSASGIPLESTDTQVRNGFMTVGVARSFWYEKMFVGTALRVIHEDNAGYQNDALVGDLGILMKPNNVITVGFSMQNIGTSKENAAQVNRGGASFQLGDFIIFAVEVNKASDDDTRVGFGMELLLPEEYLDVGQVTLRGGYYTAEDLGQSFEEDLKKIKLERTNGFSFGFGLFTSRAFGYGLALDYAFVPAGSLGTINQMSVKLKF